MSDAVRIQRCWIIKLYRSILLVYKYCVITVRWFSPNTPGGGGGHDITEGGEIKVKPFNNLSLFKGTVQLLGGSAVIKCVGVFHRFSFSWLQPATSLPPHPPLPPLSPHPPQRTLKHEF